MVKRKAKTAPFKMDECGFFCCIKNFQKRIYREIGHGTALLNVRSPTFWGGGVPVFA